MARPLRIEYPGALYHVTSRGNAREPIFLDTDDRESFLSLLAETVGRFGWLCHAYCLMDNHYHLLIETPDPNLSLGMRHLNGVYTQRFNRRHHRVGHIFQGRFKAIVVEKDSYLLELARYIVLNPVRAGMVMEASAYSWSSYQATAGMIHAPGWLTVDWILGQFAKTRSVARRRYGEFVAQGLAMTSPWPSLKGGIILGNERFIAKMRPLLDASAELQEVPRNQRWAHRPTLETLFPRNAQGDKLRRNETIRQAFAECGYTMAAIARAAGMHYSTVSKIIKGDR